VPSTVEAAIGARVRQLPESTQELLMLAAVLGVTSTVHYSPRSQNVTSPSPIIWNQTG
jgi:hypothetical protein